MPAPASTTELIDLIRKSELIPAARLDEFLARRDIGQAAGPRELAAQLLQGGLITNFQSEQFLQGKWRGFGIGRYKILERLGSGGMGTVYLAEHMMVGRKVAVKVLPTSQADNPSVLGRFYREARAAGQLNHPNLVKAHDVDQENGVHYLVMDYIDGSSLQYIVASFGPMDVTRAADYVRQTALGLQAAHEIGLVHRDVKPANIMLERDGNVRLLDLGLARFYNDQTDMLTLKYDNEHVLGTADYVAPEQALNSHEVDIRADIYSLGATFYFLLCGQPVFAGGKVAQKLIWHQVRQPTPIRKHRPDVPDAIAAVLDKMMAKDVEARYQTPSQVADALAALIRGPVAPPPEAEMPRLSPALTAAASGSPSVMVPMTPRPTRPSPQGLPPSTSIPVPARPSQIPTKSSHPGTAPRPAPAAPRPSAAGVPPATRPNGMPARPSPSANGMPRPVQTSIATAEPESSPVVALNRAPSTAEITTPRVLASAATPTDTARPRPPEAVAPSRLLEKQQSTVPSPNEGGASLLTAVVAVAVSAAVGVGLGWYFLGK